MITKYEYTNKTYRFIIPGKVKYNKNIFTILVGKNGTGKSRLLSAIIHDLYTENQDRRFYSDRLSNSRDYSPGFLSLKRNPTKIIAVSTSPFDRFPLLKFKRQIEGYAYLGIRELPAQNFGLSYMGKIIANLIEVVAGDKMQMKQIGEVLQYLGYTDRIRIKLQSRLNSRFIHELNKARNPSDIFESLSRREHSSFITINRRFFENEDGSFSKTKLAYLSKALSRANNSREFFSGIIELDKKGINSNIPYPQYIADLIFFIQGNLIRTQDVLLEKIETNSVYSINGASSGEQSVIINILGIASQIQNNALICIDEPEICLHPEWQERYIKILSETFDSYKGCHFIIATHSTQIVSNLNSQNSFILSMETGRVINASDVINHSADFQLANVFNSPGFRNEFLIRIALNLFTRISKNKNFTKEDFESYTILKKQSEFLLKTDPVFEIYNAIQEMYTLYA